MNTLNLGDPAHNQLFQDLINDPKVRAAFEKSPAAVLKERGISFDEDNPPAPGPLPSPEKLEELYQKMSKDAGGPSPMWDYFFFKS